MKVLGISGSPRRGGNTEILLDEALEGARSTGAAVEKLVLNDLNFKGCQECGGCDLTGICVVQDDMQLIYKKLESTDGLILSSPIFFGSISAQVKMMIDRLQCLWVSKYVLKRVVSHKRRNGIFICVGASKERKFFENAKYIVKIFFDILDIEYAGELFFSGVDKKAAIKDRKEALDKAFKLGTSLVRPQ